MAFDSAAGVKEQDGKAFTFRVEIRVARNVQAPIGGGLVGSVAKLQAFRRGTITESDNFVFVGLRIEFERFHELLESGEGFGGVHFKRGKRGAGVARAPV